MIIGTKHLLQKNILFFIFICSIYNLSAQTIKINEVVSSNSVHLDEDGDASDWLEIHNYGSQNVSMNGWFLSDDVNDLTQWTFPNITLTPNQYILLWASSKNRTALNYPRTLINRGDNFKYLLPTSEPNSNWKNLNFNDVNWASGTSGFGYADGDDATIIPNGTQSVYLRKTFTIDKLSTITSLILDMDYDDAFVAYINGNEVARANINGTPPVFNAGTITDHEAKIYAGGKPERFLISDFNSILIEGENILTIQAHNISSGSSDFTIIPFLSAVFSTPNNFGIEPPAILELKKSDFHTNFKISSKSETLTLTNASGTIVHQLVAENLPKNTSIGTSIVSRNT
ncbi:MAG: lamin tail domain-containing protein, partial [Polaribacter sp.]